MKGGGRAEEGAERFRSEAAESMGGPGADFLGRERKKKKKARAHVTLNY